MKRSSFKRKRSRNRSRNPFPRKKSKPMRARSPTNSYRKRERFADYMMAVKSLPCAALLVPGHVCEGPIEADHAGPRGTSQKAHDATCIPLCTRAHRERTDFAGAFRDFDQAKMRAFLFGRIQQTQRYLHARGVAIPPMKPSELAEIVRMLGPKPTSAAVDPFALASLREEGNVDVRHPDAVPSVAQGDRP